MSNNYDQYKQNLVSALRTKEEKKLHGAFLLKGDVSGIQNYIFNVPSEGAARLLKARSFLLQAITHLCIQKILENVNGQVLVNSGGSFFINLNSEINELDTLKAEINKPLLKEGLYISISQASLNQGWQYALNTIRNNEEIEKFRKYNNIPSIFEPEDVLIKDLSDEIAVIKTWKNFAKNLSIAYGFNILQKNEYSHNLKISDKSIFIWNWELSLVENEQNCQHPFNQENPTNFIIKEMPVWTEDNPYFKAFQQNDEEVIKWENELLSKQKQRTSTLDDFPAGPSLILNELIDLDHLSLQALRRTGTNKLGVLKLDVDNLGSLFRYQLPTYQQFRKASEALSYFFGPYLKEIWEEKYKDDILIIYAGGDDCFALGGWDMIFDFAERIHEEFISFSEKHLTLSASLMILDSTYPIIRIGKEAEDLLDKAKTSPGKNAINVFGEVFSWENFKMAAKIKSKLKEYIIDKGESKSILQTIRLSVRGYQAIENGIKNKNSINIQKVWNLKWFLLRKVSDLNKQAFNEDIVSKYHQAVIDALVNKKFTNALIYPMAARWTELLIRNKQPLPFNKTTFNYGTEQ